MRGWLLLLLLGCRTQPLGELDLASSDMARAACSPAVPDGFCAKGSTCCPFSCWGGNDVTGWCAPGDGCPIC